MVGKAVLTAGSSSPSVELTPAVLRLQNEVFRGSGGVSDENREMGFRPAFYDMETGEVYPSCFANGLPAPMHLLDGLPPELVLARHDSGRVSAVRSGLVAGFMRHGHFFTRAQAALASRESERSSRVLANPQHHYRLLDVWERFMLGQDYADEAIRPVVEDSWRRCHACSIDPHLGNAPLSDDAGQVEYRRYRQSDLRDAAYPVLQRAAELLHNSSSVILLTDEQGLILDIAGERKTQVAAQAVNLVPGGLWSEEAVGTNAIGTALAAREAVQLYGAEHFCSGIKHYTCSADVIHDPHDGRVIGAVDLSGLTETYQSHALDFAISAARLIETNLANAYFRSREQVLDASRALFRRWKDRGLLAFDRRGRLVRGNDLAQRMLKSLDAGLELSPQTRLAALDLDDTSQGATVAPSWLHAQTQQPILSRGRSIGTLLVLEAAQQ
ncbi:sigma-54-dependent Fis family transcriptional regulator [Marinobacterium rhizophilum]|uniref:GAF domain-containing protein n=1 Tax=Marinobacterium rhizophilum TaxID=420402 RepID=A0ABY5HJN0_9GAMM|nr:GAF domain-containing protein [Marinobacterium rhizophilum]UTW12583.1 GAF domain-containing protein [Marinobacterium rhizophilum]